jgi:hypothetical protein
LDWYLLRRRAFSARKLATISRCRWSSRWACCWLIHDLPLGADALFARRARGTTDRLHATGSEGHLNILAMLLGLLCRKFLPLCIAHVRPLQSQRHRERGQAGRCAFQRSLFEQPRRKRMPITSQDSMPSMAPSIVAAFWASCAAMLILRWNGEDFDGSRSKPGLLLGSGVCEPKGCPAVVVVVAVAHTGQTHAKPARPAQPRALLRSVARRSLSPARS